MRAERAVMDARQQTESLWQSAQTAAADRLRDEKLLAQRRFEQLLAYSPQKTLARGFALVFTGADKLVTDAKSVSDGERITVRLQNGSLHAVVTEQE